MHELREAFGSITYQIFFRIPDPATFSTPVSYIASNGRYMAEAHSIET